MSDGSGLEDRASRQEIYHRLTAVEQAFARLDTRLEERKEQAEGRYAELKENVRNMAIEGKADHEALKSKVDEVAASVQASRVTPLQIMVGTSPMVVAVITLVGVVLSK